MAAFKPSALTTAMGEEKTSYNLPPGMRVAVPSPESNKTLKAKKAEWASQNKPVAPKSFDR